MWCFHNEMKALQLSAEEVRDNSRSEYVGAFPPPAAGADEEEVELKDSAAASDDVDDGMKPSPSPGCSTNKYDNFSFGPAMFFVSSFAGTHILAFLASAILTFILMSCLVVRELRVVAWTYGTSIIANWIVNGLIIRKCVVQRWLANDSTVVHPRLYAAVDILYGLTLGVAWGVLVRPPLRGEVLRLVCDRAVCYRRLSTDCSSPCCTWSSCRCFACTYQ